MRDIKFRGKRQTVDAWVDGYLDFDEDAHTHTIDGYLVNSETIGQYTGLKDKNEKEIYEGDIVTAWFPGMPHDIRATQEITFMDGCYCCGSIPLKVMDLNFLDVVGNIYDNPRLQPR